MSQGRDADIPPAVLKGLKDLGILVTADVHQDRGETDGIPPTPDLIEARFLNDNRKTAQSLIMDCSKRFSAGQWAAISAFAVLKNGDSLRNPRSYGSVRVMTAGMNISREAFQLLYAHDIEFRNLVYGILSQLVHCGIIDPKILESLAPSDKLRPKRFQRPSRRVIMD